MYRELLGLEMKILNKALQSDKVNLSCLLLPQVTCQFYFAPEQRRYTASLECAFSTVSGHWSKSSKKK